MDTSQKAAESATAHDTVQPSAVTDSAPAPAPASVENNSMDTQLPDVPTLRTEDSGIQVTEAASETEPSEAKTLAAEGSGTATPAPSTLTAPEGFQHNAGHDLDDAASQHTFAAPSLETDQSEHGGRDFDDHDSAIGSWRSTRTQSLTSSVVNFKYENGRRYHAFREGEYHLPNDESEQDRLDLQHAIFRYANDDKLFMAPLDRTKIYDVLDVGCGTGKWAMDVADELPQASVLGFDLSPIQPDLVPPNCRFLVDDCNADWLFAERFDLIHTRAMTPGIKDWPRYMQQAFDHLKPGGYIELHEIHCPAGVTDATADPPPYFLQWSQYLVEAGVHVSFDFSAPKKLESLLLGAGFQNVTLQWQNWPVGPWAKGAKNKNIGRWWAEDMKDVTKGTSALFTRVLGWKQEEFDVFAARIASEIDSGEKHMWIEMCFAYGQKPL